MAKYNASDIEVLKGFEAVRRRPGMYVGDLEDGSGMHWIFWGMVSNAIAEALRGGGSSYVRVEIDCTLSPRRQIALLAHELQHALEIGERTDILDADGMESLYEEIGSQSADNGSHRSYETEAAKAAQRAVDHEIGGRSGRGVTGSNAY